MSKTPISAIHQCPLCGKIVTAKRFIYCPSCSMFHARLYNHGNLSDEAKQGILDYVQKHKFTCHFTGMALNMKDPKDPWYCVFDRLIPGDDRTMVLTSFLINDMKSEMSEVEFWRMIEQLFNFKKYGTPVEKIELKYWKGFFVPPKLKAAIATRKCTVCGAEYAPVANNQKYCHMCGELIWRMEVRKYPLATRKAVLDYIRQYGYVCYYTGMPLDQDPRSPWYVVLDHWLPQNPGKLVVTSALFNTMKTDLTEKEFWYFIGQLYNCHFKGKNFRKKKLDCWARVLPPAWAA